MIKFLLSLLLVCPLFAAQPEIKHCTNETEAWNIAQTYATVLGAKIIVTSGTPSMRPLIKGRVFVLLKDDYLNVQIRDIVLRESILHRIISKIGNEYVMAGDCNYANDKERLTYTNYCGTAIMIVTFR